MHAESAERKEEWLKHLSDGGAWSPTIKTQTKLGKQLAKQNFQNRFGIHRRKTRDEDEAGDASEEDSD